MVVELEGAEPVEIEVVIKVTSHKLMRVSAQVSITDFDASGDLFKPILVDLDCEGQIREAQTLDISNGNPMFQEIGAQFEDMTPPSEFHCLATITPQAPVPQQELAMTVEATAAWRGEVDAVDVLVDATIR